MTRPTGTISRPRVGRSVVSTQLGIVAANHPLAAAAGVDMLQRGGNAVDAAIAANAMMGLVEPASNGIGGDLFVLYNEARTGKTFGLNASGGHPPRSARTSCELKGFLEMPATGIHTVTVPGAVAGWDALRDRFGTCLLRIFSRPRSIMPRKDSPSPKSLRKVGKTAPTGCATHPNTAKTYLIDGRPPRSRRNLS